MDQDYYNLGVRIAEGEMFSAGIAYVVIPSDIDRGIYISECFKTATVSIYNEHNGFSSRVPVDKHSLSFIEFPTDVKQFGTAVSFIVDPIHNHPIVTGIFFKSDEICDLMENQFKFKRQMGANFVEVVGSPANKNLQLNINADTEGELLINVQSKDQSGKVSIAVDGEIAIQALTTTDIRQFGKFAVTTVDMNNEDAYATLEQSSNAHSFWDESHNINTKSLKINNGEEPIILGKKWASFMKGLITELSKTTTETALGQMPILNSSQVLAYHDKVDELLSTIGFIDK